MIVAIVVLECERRVESGEKENESKETCLGFADCQRIICPIGNDTVPDLLVLLLCRSVLYPLL